VIFQAALGVWTLILLVKRAIVTAHLLGGFATFVLLVLRCGRCVTGRSMCSMPTGLSP
jgi:heme A synthase